MRSLRELISSLLEFLFWLALVVCGIECSRQQVRMRRYEHPLDLPDIEAAKGLDMLHAVAEAEFANADARRRIVDDKARMLLTLVGLLIPVTATLAARLEGPSLVLLPLSCFLFSALTLVGYLGVGAGMQLKVSPDDAILDEAALKRQMIVGLLRSARVNQQFTDFLVDVYRASLRALFLGLLLVVVIAGIAYTRRAQVQERPVVSSPQSKVSPTLRP